MENLYKEYRCQQCNKLLFKGLLAAGENRVEIKCKSCKSINTFQGVDRGRVLPQDTPGSPGEGKAFKMD